MQNKQLRAFWLAVALIVGLTVTNAEAQGRRQVLENFTGDRFLDTAIWLPTRPGWGNGIQQVNREIRRGALNLAIRATSQVDSPDDYPVSGNEFFRRNRLFINADKIRGIKGLEAEITVNDSQVTGCPLPGSGQTEATKSRARAMIQAAAFNDGSSTGEDDLTGDYLVELALEKSDTTRGTARFVDISVWITRADNADASEATEVVRKIIGRARHGERVRLTSRWNLQTNVITFKATNLTRRGTSNFRYNFRRLAPNPVVSPNSRLWGNIQSRTILPRCRPTRGTVRRPTAMIDADYDNIAWYR